MGHYADFGMIRDIIAPLRVKKRGKIPRGEAHEGFSRVFSPKGGNDIPNLEPKSANVIIVTYEEIKLSNQISPNITKSLCPPMKRTGRSVWPTENVAK